MKRRLAVFSLCVLTAASARASAWLELQAAAGGAVRAPAPAVTAKPVASPASPVVAARDASGIELVGSPAFVSATRAALELLRPLPQFALIRRNLWRIEESRCSGIVARAHTFHVGAKTWRSAPVWYAGTIAHDSYHVEAEGPAAVPTGDPAGEERVCLLFQVGVVEALQGSEAQIKYLRGLAQHPTYQNIGAGKTEFNTGTANDVCSERNW